MAAQHRTSVYACLAIISTNGEDAGFLRGIPVDFFDGYDLCRAKRRPNPAVSNDVVDLDVEKYSGLDDVGQLLIAGVVDFDVEGVAHGFVAVLER